MSKIKSVHEVYFLVRVGQMTEEDLNNWLQQNIEASQYEEEDIGEYEKDVFSEMGWDDDITF